MFLAFAYPTVIVTALPRLTFVPTLGEIFVTALTFLTPIFFTTTFSSRSVSAARALASVSEKTFGINTYSDPLETVKIILVPLASGAPPDGTCEITVPARTLSLN